MGAITPFLWFDNEAETAARRYVSIFEGSKITSVKRAGKGKDAPVFSVTFRLRGQNFIAINGGKAYQFSPAVSFFVSCKTQKEIDYFWKKLTDGGEEQPCGWLKDKFGLSWQIVPEGLDRWLQNPLAMQAMLQMKKLDIKKLQTAAKKK